MPSPYIAGLTRALTELLAVANITQFPAPAEREDRSTRAWRDADCAIRHTQAGMAEDLLLLPTLMKSLERGGPGQGAPVHRRSGIFVEIGALDGITGSNTYMLEKCFGWTGVLIEGNPTNFARLRKSERSAAMVHASVCPPSAGSVTMTEAGEGVAANVDAMGPSIKKYFWSQRGQLARTVTVPCVTMSALLDACGFGHADYLSVDVEGGEDKILAGTDPSRFTIIETEELPAAVRGSGRRGWNSATVADPAKEARVHSALTAAGFRRSSSLWLPWGRLYLSGEAQEVSMLRPAPTRQGLDTHMALFGEGGMLYRARVERLVAALPPPPADRRATVPATNPPFKWPNWPYKKP